MNVIFWVIFIGLCIRTGLILISFLINLFSESGGTKNLHHIFHDSLIILITGLKAYIAFLIVKISLKLNCSNPFNEYVASLISKISYIAIGTGILAIVINGISKWIIKKENIVFQELNGVEFLYFAGIIFVIGQVFKKGIEIQRENDLTV